MNEFEHSINNSIEAKLLESTNNERPQSPVPDDKGEEFTSAETRPHKVQSLLPENNFTRAVSPNKLVIFPPEIPFEYHTYSKPSTPEPKNKSTIMIKPSTFTTTYKTHSQAGNTIFQCPDELKYLPKFHGAKGPISMAMEIAPDRPFTPVAVTEPIIKPAPWIPLPIENEYRPESPLVAALKTAPERSYSPLPTFMYASELVSTPIENPTNTFKKSISVNETSVANNFNLKPSESNTSTRLIGNNPVKYMHGYNKTPIISLQNNKTFQPIPTINTQKKHIFDLESKSYLTPNDKSSISGPYEPAESKSNYNTTFISRVPRYKNSDISQPNYLFSTTDQNVSLNHSDNSQKTLKLQRDIMSDDKSTSCRSLGPGIKNKVFTFTSNASIYDTQFLRQSSNNDCKVNLSVDDKYTSLIDKSCTHKSNNPNSVKLTKAVPFFSNSTSSFSSLL